MQYFSIKRGSRSYDKEKFQQHKTVSLEKDLPNPKTRIDIKNMTPEKCAWLAGLFQGEAQFGKDSRVRSKIKTDKYSPPPPAPFIKLDMVEEDLMLYVAGLLGEERKVLNRRTSTKKIVYRVTIYSREKVETFLNLILPYVYGELKRGLILDLLAECDNHKKWLTEGGRSNAARHAALSSARDKNKFSH